MSHRKSAVVSACLFLAIGVLCSFPNFFIFFIPPTATCLVAYEYLARKQYWLSLNKITLILTVAASLACLFASIGSLVKGGQLRRNFALWYFSFSLHSFACYRLSKVMLYRQNLENAVQGTKIPENIRKYDCTMP
jgi:hypothetical protein